MEPVRVGLLNRVPNTARHFLYTLAQRRSHVEFVRVGKPNGAPNTANTTVMRTSLILKPRKFRTSWETQHCAKHRTALLVCHNLAKKPIGIRRVGKHNGVPNTANACPMCQSITEKTFGIHTSRLTQQCQTPQCTSLYPCLAKSHFGFVRAGTLNGVRNTAFAPLVFNSLTDKPY